VKKTKPSLEAAVLRQQAEARLNQHLNTRQPDQVPDPSDVQRLLHELQVHQIELELQNEELLRVGADLEQSLAQYSDLYDFAPIGYFTLAQDGTICRCNLSGARLLGLERAKLIQRRFGLWLEDASRPVFTAFLQRTFASQAKQTCEVCLAREGAERVCICLEATLTEDRQACRLVLLDITERKRAEEALQQLNAELEQRIAERTRELHDAQEHAIRQEHLAVLGQLAGGVSHELRNPLGNIHNAIYLLKLILPDAGEQVKKYLEIIQQENHAADKIITDLLDFSRSITADRERCVAGELIHRTLERYPVPAPIQVALEIAPGPLQLYVDERQIVQVLGNLVTNACQAMPNGGQLTISAKQSTVEGQTSVIIIAVKDSGVGISPGDMQKLFEPLFTTRATGIGLGLAVSKKLAEANGGKIEVQSEFGKGSTFSLFLPWHKVNP